MACLMNGLIRPKCHDLAADAVSQNREEEKAKEKTTLVCYLF